MNIVMGIPDLMWFHQGVFTIPAGTRSTSAPTRSGAAVGEDVDGRDGRGVGLAAAASVPSSSTSTKVVW